MILCEKGTYIHPANLDIDFSVIQSVIDFISEQSDRTALSYNEVYCQLENTLNAAGVKNQFILHGALKQNGCPFVLTKDYICKSMDATFDNDFVAYIKQRYPISVASVAKHFYLSDLQCRQVVDRCSQLSIKGPMVFWGR